MYTLKEINSARLNNPDAGEKTIFLDQADGAVKTKDENGVIEELAVGASIPDGGTTGQVLAKATDTDGDTEWVDAGGGGPLVYKAFLSQSGTSAPTVVVVANTLGGTVVWTRVNTGRYVGTLAGAFPATKTIGPNLGAGVLNIVGGVDIGIATIQYSLYRTTDNTIALYVGTTGGGGDFADLNGQAIIPIFIEVYP